MAYLFNKYWSAEQRVTVVGFKRPEFELPPNFKFYSVCMKELPADRWVDAARNYLETSTDSHFIMFHEDYWLVRKVNLDIIQTLYEFANAHGDIVRVDLTGDRLYASDMHDVAYLKDLDIIEAPGSQYEMSHQAGIFNRKHYLNIVSRLAKDQRSAWNVELEGTSIINNNVWMKVYGTRQWPVRYANGMLKGKLDLNELKKIEKNDYNKIVEWIPEHYLKEDHT